jgi:hypothetical protein
LLDQRAAMYPQPTMEEEERTAIHRFMEELGVI